MTEKADPYLKLSSPFDSICVICETEIKGNKSKLQDNGWNNFKIQAKRWQEITIPSGDSKYIYTKLYDKIKNFDCAQGFAHLSFRTNLEQKLTFMLKGMQKLSVTVKVLHRKYQSNENRLITKSCVLFVNKNGSRLIVSQLTRVS